MRFLVSLLISFAAVASHAQDEAARFRVLLEDDWEYVLEHAPEFATYVGDPRYNDRWSDRSLEAVDRWNARDREQLEAIQEIDREQLSSADQLNYDLYRYNRETDVAGQRFPSEYMPVNQLDGVHQDVAGMVNRMPAQSVKHFEDIVARIESADTIIDQTVARMQWGLELGVTPPAITLRDVPDQIRNQIVDDATESPIYRPFREMPESIAAEDWARLEAAAAEAIAMQVIPAYQRMHAFFVNEYLPAARESIAASALPDGDEWYRWSVRRMTTTDLTPDEIHNIGLAEVKRIREEMEEIIDETGFDGDFEAFSYFLQTDPQFYFTDKDALLVAYRDIAKRLDPELPKLFGTLPRNPYGVRAVPSYAEKSQTTAYYMPGAPAAGRAGYFYANTYALNTRPKWEMEALTAHEAMPGHHLQISIAQELEGVPKFRRFGGYTAFVEGWGLYSESLGGELGLYKDPYSKYGQLTYEMWRAIRLVVDTGMHSKGWTRQQAIDFFAANSSKQLHDITVEVDRYIVWPGQALAYKLGELKFKALRARAAEALGDSFDIRRFHDALLEHGALPLDLVEANIETWIENEKRK